MLVHAQSMQLATQLDPCAGGWAGLGQPSKGAAPPPPPPPPLPPPVWLSLPPAPPPAALAPPLLASGPPSPDSPSAPLHAAKADTAAPTIATHSQVFPIRMRAARSNP